MVNGVFCSLNYLAMKIASTLSKKMGVCGKYRLTIKMKWSKKYSLFASF